MYIDVGPNGHGAPPFYLCLALLGSNLQLALSTISDEYGTKDLGGKGVGKFTLGLDLWDYLFRANRNQDLLFRRQCFG